MMYGAHTQQNNTSIHVHDIVTGGRVRGLVVLGYSNVLGLHACVHKNVLAGGIMDKI